MDLAELIADVDRLVTADPAALADREGIAELHRQLDRLEAVAARADAAFDAAGGWRADGARSAAAWLAVSCHHPKSNARQRVRRGRGLRHLPAAEEAWLDGAISAAHV